MLSYLAAEILLYGYVCFICSFLKNHPSKKLYYFFIVLNVALCFTPYILVFVYLGVLNISLLIVAGAIFGVWLIGVILALFRHSPQYRFGDYTFYYQSYVKKGQFIPCQIISFDRKAKLYTLVVFNPYVIKDRYLSYSREINLLKMSVLNKNQDPNFGLTAPVLVDKSEDLSSYRILPIDDISFSSPYLNPNSENK